MENKHDALQKTKKLEQHEVKQVLGFLKHYGKMIVIGVVAATLVILASKGAARWKADKTAQAEELLIAAQSPQQLEELIERYKSTPVAPVALLNLAKTHFNEGDYFLARAQYERFLKRYKTHELAPLADYGLACCTEADGAFGEAVELFKTFIATQDGHYLQSPATLALARSLEQANRADEARIVLENFLTATPGSLWSSQAEAALQKIAR